MRIYELPEVRSILRMYDRGMVNTVEVADRVVCLWRQGLLTADEAGLVLRNMDKWKRRI